jgi:polyribonucleotide nucleotidyltransferase
MVRATNIEVNPVTKITKEIKFGEHTLVLETGEIARQADGAVFASMEGTQVLVSVVGNKEGSEKNSFFPMTVNYQEKSYAAGKIPGGFNKREGRPSDHETLVSRLIDRPIRPLFPDDFYNEVQIIATVMSLNPEVPADIVAMIGASAALAISGLPFQGPIGAARVGYKDGIYLLNPGYKALTESDLDLVVAGTEDAILMVESEAYELSEEVMLGAVLFGHEMMKPVIKAIKELAGETGKASWDWTGPVTDTNLQSRIEALAADEFTQAYLIKNKPQRYQRLAEIRQQVTETLQQEQEDVGRDSAAKLLSTLEKNIVRNRILNGEPRIDGRDQKTVRPIAIRTGFLARTHGSALFTRGETQAIVAATLGSDRDAQTLDRLEGETKDRFMLHYNFPPYSVGETGMVGSPKRREIGHGRLARRSLSAVLPSASAFPYVLRVVSDITESNGSSSMATVCGTSLALMDAGVPLKAPVAGVAMGLIKEGDRFAVLTDILGDEDHLGDMDFKVAGTENGVTALQMDIKITGITKEIMEQALEQALAGRLHILNVMNNALAEHREELSEHAPRIVTMKVAEDKIRTVIGKGGSTIKGLIESTGVSIDIDDTGVVQLFSPNADALAEAQRQIKALVAEVEVGQTYRGRVNKIVDFGAFINLLPGKDGLLHISQICAERSQKVEDVLQEGQEIEVFVAGIDKQGRVKLEWKDKPAPAAKEPSSEEEHQETTTVESSEETTSSED